MKKIKNSRLKTRLQSLSVLAIALSFTPITIFAQATNANKNQRFSISGISSGGFMSVQMATIYSNEFLGVGSVAGGFFYCAKNGLQEQILAGQNNLLGTSNLLLFEPTGKINAKTLSPEFRPSISNPVYMPVGVCMGNPAISTLPSMSQFEYDKVIEPMDNFKNLQVYIYNGKNDSVVKNSMIQKLYEFYTKNGVSRKQIKIAQTKGGHNFPTNKKGLNACEEQSIPYISSCNYDAAGDILSHMLKKRLSPAVPNPDHLYVVDQTLNHLNTNSNDIKELKQPVQSVSGYGYLYASDQCLNNPDKCHLHVALHGCEMSDSFDKDFDELFQKQIINYKIMGMRSERDKALPFSNLPTIEQRNNKFGTLKFAENAGYIEYAESNDIMVLFPQTWITSANYPYNPKGCWDWFGWTGSNYATLNGEEPSWLMSFMKKIKENPKSYILNIKKPLSNQTQ